MQILQGKKLYLNSNRGKMLPTHQSSVDSKYKIESRNKMFISKIVSKESIDSILKKSRRSIEYIEPLTPLQLNKPRIQDLIKFKFDVTSKKLKQSNLVPDREIFKDISPIK